MDRLKGFNTHANDKQPESPKKEMAHLLLKIVSEWKEFRQFGSDLLLYDLSVKRIYVSTMEFVTKASCFSVSILSYLFAIATNHFITCIFLLLI